MMVHQKILTYLYTIGGNFNDYVLSIPFQKKPTLMFPGGIINKGQFKLEFFDVIFPFRIKRNNENDLFWNWVLNCVLKDIRKKWILRCISAFSTFFSRFVFVFVFFSCCCCYSCIFDFCFCFSSFFYSFLIFKKAKTLLSFVLYFLLGICTGNRI